MELKNERKVTSAVSDTLNVREVSLNRRFSVGTNPSRNIFIPKRDNLCAQRIKNKNL